MMFQVFEIAIDIITRLIRFTCSVPNGPQWSCDRCPKPDAQCINVLTKHVIPETHVAAVILPRGAENHAAQASSFICFPWGRSLDIHIVTLCGP